MRNLVRQDGQASVELIAVVPALILAMLVAAQLVLAGYALWSAGSAAHAGARAAYVGADPEAAALKALPPALRAGATVSRQDGVEVSVKAPSLLPGVPEVPVAGRAGLDAGGAGG